MILSSGSALAAGNQISIRRISTAAFPKVRATVSLPSDDPSALTVEENGSTVSPVDVQSFVDRAVVVDVVLAVDTSGSMQGAPLTAALDAASSFIDALPANVRVGVVTFSDEARVVQPITKDHNAVQAAISGLQATGETSLYDAVSQAATLFKGAHQRNIVLLSDGGDTTSTATLGEATSAASKAQATIYAVGLESTETDVRALQLMSKATGGSYAPAASADLSGVYQGLAQQLKGQYFVSYTSKVPNGEQMSISMSDSSGNATAIALAPQLATAPGSAPKPQVVAPKDHLIDGTGGLIAVLVVTFLAIFGLLYLFLVVGSAERRDRELGRRMGAGGGPDEGAQSTGAVSWIPEPLIELADQIAQSRGSTEALERKLERAGWRLKVGEFLAGVGLAAIGGFILGLLLVQKPLFGLLAAALGAATPLVILSIRTTRRMSKLHAQLPDILSILASSLRAGHSFLQSLDAVGHEIGGPGGEEFGRLTAEIRLGKTVDSALSSLAERVGSDDFKWAVLAVSIQREVGGNLAEVLDTVADTMRERDQIRRQVDVLSAEGRLSLYILAGLPLVIGLYLALVNPDYFGLLFHTRIGVVMLVTAACLEIVGVAWMKKVVKIDV